MRKNLKVNPIQNRKYICTYLNLLEFIPLEFDSRDNKLRMMSPFILYNTMPIGTGASLTTQYFTR